MKYTQQIIDPIKGRYTKPLTHETLTPTLLDDTIALYHDTPSVIPSHWSTQPYKEYIHQYLIHVLKLAPQPDPNPNNIYRINAEETFTFTFSRIELEYLNKTKGKPVFPLNSLSDKTTPTKTRRNPIMNQPNTDINPYATRIIDLMTSYDPLSCIDYPPVIIDELDEQHIIPYRR